MEKVIIVMTTYNLKDYVAEAIDSVLKQKTTFDFKILIGDDCSTDGTIEILRNYEKEYPDKIEVLYSDVNLGSLKNSNRLFDHLDSEYFAFLDGDDVWLNENHLQSEVDFLDQHLEYSMCAGNTQYLRNGHPAEFLLKENELNKSYTFDDYLNDKMPFFHVSSILLRNNIFKNGLPDCFRAKENTFENCALRGEDFRRVIHLETGPLYAMDSLLSYYRIHENGIWQGASESRKLIEAAIGFNFYRKYYMDSVYSENFHNKFLNAYRTLLWDLFIHYDRTLSKKDTYLLVSLLEDIADLMTESKGKITKFKHKILNLLYLIINSLGKRK